MIVVCKKCNTKYRYDEKLVEGKTGKTTCQKCGHTILVGSPSRPRGSSGKQKMVFFDLKSALSNIGRDNIIAFSNQKGGVAKTSTCLNLGMSLSLYKKKVLMIDFDSQANLTLSLGYKNKSSFFEYVESKSHNLNSYTIKTRYSGLHLLPSNSNMALLNKRYFGVKHFEFLLKDRLNQLADQFDFILIDTPPSIDFFTFNALTAARMVVIPCPCEFLSTHGVNQIEKLIGMIKAKTNPQIEFRILVTMFNKDETSSRLIYNKLQKMYPGKLFQTSIEMDGKLKESQIVSMPAIAYDRGSLSGRQYLDLAKEMLPAFRGVQLK